MPRRWTVEEENILEQCWGSYTLSHIATKLNRSINSIKIKAYKMNLGKFINQGEYITFNQLLSAIGFEGSYSHYFKKLVKHQFPIKYKTVINRKYRIVYLQDFWEWAEQNKHILNFAKFQKNSLGVEPKWVDLKRKYDMLNNSKLNHNRPWTRYDDNLLQSRLKLYKYTYAQLASEFNRTEGAIKRRIATLGLKEKPIPRDNHIKWTEEEITLMKKLYSQGLDNSAIAGILDKSALSIGNKLLEYGKDLP